MEEVHQNSFLNVVEHGNFLWPKKRKLDQKASDEPWPKPPQP
jgi:hypothetical protein